MSTFFDSLMKNGGAFPSREAGYQPAEATQSNTDNEQDTMKTFFESLMERGGVFPSREMQPEGEKKPPQPAEDTRPVQEQIDETLAQMKALALPAALFNPAEETPGLTSSRAAGTPAWPKGRDYPVDAAGKPMTFLAQINFSEFTLPDFPEAGLIQFFVSGDDVYGCNFPSGRRRPASQEGFQVIYHEDLSVLEEAKDYYEDLSRDHYTPFDQGEAWEIPAIGLSCEVQPHTPTPACYHVDKLLENKSDKFHEETEDLFYDQPRRILQVGGHPDYTQYDIRAEDGDYAEYDRTLLSINSDHGVFMWGDCGIANFMIPREALLQKDFSKTIYTWDCC